MSLTKEQIADLTVRAMTSREDQPISVSKAELHALLRSLEADASATGTTDEHLALAKRAIKAMAEDGWLYFGVEGMNPAQELCYDAYIKLGLKELGDEVEAPPTGDSVRVPREPTENMVKRFMSVYCGGSFALAYRAMLAAAPVAATGAQEAVLDGVAAAVAVAVFECGDRFNELPEWFREIWDRRIAYALNAAPQPAASAPEEKAMLPEANALAGFIRDGKRIDWLEDNHTLHQKVEILYVVDGYQVTLMHEDGFTEKSPRFEGHDLRAAIDEAMSHV